MSLTVCSLFDGIGGFCLAFQRTGADVVATVEIDPAAAAISRRHFPQATQFEDVTKVTADDIRAAGFVPERGVLTAGWPCQDFSVAGRRAGLAGARSGLWWHVARILAELRPAWFIGENVPGLLSSVCQCPGDGTCVANGHRDTCDGEPHDVKPTGCCAGGCMETHGGAMGSVLGSLAELGYGVAYRVLDAQYFGVPQQRRRVFIVGHLGAPFGAPAQVLLEPESSGGDPPAGGKTWPEVASTLMAGTNSTGGTRPPGTQVDTVGTLVTAPMLTARYAKGTDSDATDALILQEHTHTHLDASGRREAGIPDRRRISGGRAWREGGPSYGISATERAIPGVATETVVRRLTELECERLQGYPDGWTDDQYGSPRYRQLGNSVAVPVVQWIAERLTAVDSSLT